MNKKYFIHFSWIVTLIMLAFLVLCLFDNMSIVYPICMYVVAMIVYVLPMSYIKSKEAKLTRLEFSKELIDEKSIEQIINKRTNRVLTYEDEEKKIYQMNNKYYKWLTKEIILEKSSDRIYLTIPNTYIKYFCNI
ncbi:MAG: hypothetical protein ACI4E1_00720 [Lachnospira sp.]